MRNIRTAKEILDSLLTNRWPSREELLTFLAEVERIMNSTPIIEVPLDSTDDDPLTPYHYLVGEATACQSCGEAAPSSSLKRRWQNAQCISGDV